MSVKSIVNDKPLSPPKSFPKLMIGDDGAIYFVRNEGGMFHYLTLDGANTHRKTGWVSENRELSPYLKDLEGSITLSNE